MWDEWEAEEVPFLRDDQPWRRAHVIVGTASSIPHDPPTEVAAHRGTYSWLSWHRRRLPVTVPADGRHVRGHCHVALLTSGFTTRSRCRRRREPEVGERGQPPGGMLAAGEHQRARRLVAATGRLERLRRGKQPLPVVVE